ncbi:hypothetical protein VTK56DRAFT_8330 [Thermocarpiscus australiensis]
MLHDSMLIAPFGLRLPRLCKIAAKTAATPPHQAPSPSPPHRPEWQCIATSLGAWPMAHGEQTSLHTASASIFSRFWARVPSTSRIAVSEFKRTKRQ